MFLTNPIEPPFLSEKYVQCISECKEAGVEICIVDSLTHLWDGEGGSKDKQANIAKRTGNGFTSWREPKKEFRTVIDKILQTDIHFIVTMRAKTDYSQEKDSNGKTIVRKIGLNPIVAEGTDFEFTVVFDLDTDHIAGVSKDRTSIFDGTFHKITPETGYKLSDYLLSAPAQKPTEPAPKSVENPNTGTETVEVNVEDVVSSITSTFKSIMDSGVDKEILYGIVAEHNDGKKNWLGLKDIEKAVNILQALKEYKK